MMIETRSRASSVRPLPMVAGVLFASMLVTACAGWSKRVRASAIGDLACPDEGIVVEHVQMGNPSVFVARGCGREREYMCVNNAPPRETLAEANAQVGVDYTSCRPMGPARGIGVTTTKAEAATSRRPSAPDAHATQCDSRCSSAGESCSRGCDGEACVAYCRSLTRGCIEGCLDARTTPE